jgi:hypothetical protein
MITSRIRSDTRERIRDLQMRFGIIISFYRFSAKFMVIPRLQTIREAW